jgi:peptidyl-prolyl cis-trans isomerase C
LLTAAACERRDVGRKTSPGPAVARVNDKMLYKTDFETYLPGNYSSALTMGEKKEYLDRWITTELLYEEALRNGSGLTPDIQLQLEQFKKELIADRLVQGVIREKAGVSEAEVQAYYTEHEDEYTRELRVSHILINSLEDAEKVREQLQKQSFSWVARRHSIDKHTGPGGDLGFLSKGNMLPEFEEVVYDMEIGEVSDVIESELGYHFVKVTAARDARNKLTLEDVAEDISRILLMEKRAAVYDSLIAAVYDDARIEILDPDLRLVTELMPDTVLVRERENE